MKNTFQFTCRKGKCWLASCFLFLWSHVSSPWMFGLLDFYSSAWGPIVIHDSYWATLNKDIGEVVQIETFFCVTNKPRVFLESIQCYVPNPSSSSITQEIVKLNYYYFFPFEKKLVYNFEYILYFKSFRSQLKWSLIFFLMNKKTLKL